MPVLRQAPVLYQTYLHRSNHIKKRLVITYLLLSALVSSPQAIYAREATKKTGLRAKAWSEKIDSLSKVSAENETTEDPQQAPSGWRKKIPDLNVENPADENTKEADGTEVEEEAGNDTGSDTAENSEESTEETTEEATEEDASATTEDNSAAAKLINALQKPGDWEPFVEMDEQLFPSFLLSTSIVKLDPPETPDPTIIGDRNGLAGIAIKNPAPNTRVRVELKDNLIMHASKLDAILEKENEIYFLCPPVSFKYDALLKQKQPMPLSLNFSLSINGKEENTKPKTILIRSINDCPTFFISQTDNSHADVSFMFAAYVNESHPMIDMILQEALKTKIVNGFTGYQSGSEEEVINQVYAIWTALQKRGIKYSSITTPSAHSEDIVSQNVRFIDESLNYSQANCVDGSVLIASILYKIGINPFLVIVPGHMYLGFYLDEESKSICCLETTLLSEGKGEEFFHETLKETLTDYEKDEKKFIADNDPDYQLIDIDEARKMGIVPIAFSR